jgi:hypothetical protein
MEHPTDGRTTTNDIHPCEFFAFEALRDALPRSEHATSNAQIEFNLTQVGTIKYTADPAVTYASQHHQTVASTTLLSNCIATVNLAQQKGRY